MSGDLGTETERFMDAMKDSLERWSPEHWVEQVIVEHRDAEPRELAMWAVGVLRRGGWMRNRPKPWKDISPAERIERGTKNDGTR